MKKLHEDLLSRMGWYRRWHEFPNSGNIHLIVLFLVFLLFGAWMIMGLKRDDQWRAASPLLYSRNKDGFVSPAKGGVAGIVRDRILIKFNSSVVSEKRGEIFSRHGLRGFSDIPGIDVALVSLPAEVSAEEIISRLLREESVEFAETDNVLAPSFFPNDPWFPNWQKNKQIIGAEAAWNSITGNENIAIAVLDTGVDCTHEDLLSNCVIGWNFYDNNTGTVDVTGHGTKVAGVAAASGNNGMGVAGTVWSAKIMPIRVSDPQGFAPVSIIASAIVYAADHGAKVANISYEAAGSKTVQSAASYMRRKGGLVFISAGNGGIFTSNQSTRVALVISATDSEDLRYSWSNYGGEIDFSAPGCTGATTAPNGGYSSFCGTSASAPEAAGLAALVWSLDPTLNPSEVEKILASSAKDLGDLGWDPYYGWGRIDAALAITHAIDLISSGTSSAKVPQGKKK